MSVVSIMEVARSVVLILGALSNNGDRIRRTGLNHISLNQESITKRKPNQIIIYSPIDLLFMCTNWEWENHTCKPPFATRATSDTISAS